MYYVNLLVAVMKYVENLHDNEIPVCNELLKLREEQKMGNKLFFWVCPVCGNKDYNMSNMWLAPRSSMTEDEIRSILVAINSVYGLPKSKNIEEFAVELTLDYDGDEQPLINWDKVKDNKIKTFYICDRKACEDCSYDCHHTSDITHAINFEKSFNGVDYREKEDKDGSER